MEAAAEVPAPVQHLAAWGVPGGLPRHLTSPATGAAAAAQLLPPAHSEERQHAH